MDNVEKVFYELKYLRKVVDGVIISAEVVRGKHKVKTFSQDKEIINTFYFNKKNVESMRLCRDEIVFSLLHENGHYEYVKDGWWRSFFATRKIGNFKFRNHREEYYADKYAVETMKNELNYDDSGIISAVEGFVKKYKNSEGEEYRGNKSTSKHPAWNKRIKRIECFLSRLQTANN